MIFGKYKDTISQNEAFTNWILFGVILLALKKNSQQHRD